MRSTTDETSGGLRWGAVQVAFVLSGACALAYEVLWGRWLATVLGSSATATCVVLAAYMSGQALGAAAFGRLSSRLVHPLRAYAVVEVAIGASALAFPWLAQFSLGLPGAARVALAVAILATPTFLLGGTVPLVLRWSEAVGRPGGATLGRLYGLNTLGAALGCIATGFWWIPWLGLTTTNSAAAAGNFAIAAAMLWLARAPALAPPAAAAPQSPAAAASARTAPLWMLLAAAFLSGVVTLGIEVVWIRLLRITLSSTTYTFTLVVATFILGIGLGGLWAGRQREDAPVAVLLAKAQLVLVALLLVDWFAAPYTQLQSALLDSGASFGDVIGEAVLTCVLLILPATLVMGFLFPLLGRLFMARGRRGEEVGALYLVNTLGAVVGAVAATVLLIPQLGSSHAYLLFVALGFVSLGLYLALAGELLASTWKSAAGTLALTFAVVAIVHPGWSPFFLGVGAYYVQFGSASDLAATRDQEILYFAEGPSSTVLVHPLPVGRIMRVDGKPVASTGPGDVANQLMLGHLPAVLAGEVRSGLVVGLGTGMTLGALAEHELERLDQVELEPRVIDGARFFDDYNGGVLDRPELHLIVDDGYNFLHAGSQSYDVITSDPIQPFFRGAATLYSREYFERARARLSERGVFAHWLPLSNMGLEDFRLIVRTFLAVFPDARLYWNGAKGSVIVGRKVAWSDPDVDARQYAHAEESLRKIGVASADELASLRVAGADVLGTWVGRGPINSVDEPRLEFSAPRSMFVPTVDTNLQQLVAMHEESPPPPTVDERVWRATGAALAFPLTIAPQADYELATRYLEDALGCGAESQPCAATRLDSGLAGRLLWHERYRRGEARVRQLRAAARDGQPLDAALVDDALDALARARALSRDPEGVEDRAVERRLAQLRELLPPDAPAALRLQRILETPSGAPSP